MTRPLAGQTRVAVADVVGYCNDLPRVRSAAKFLAPDLVVRATHRGRVRARDRLVELVVKIGKPNFRERVFIRQCLTAGEPFPVKRFQFRSWPKVKK